MQPVTAIRGTMVGLDRADVDTDQIMPKQYLKRIERTGFGEFLFADWRRDPGFVLNDPGRQGARVLVTGANFGAGSSREHAPWGLQQWGFQAVVAPSFADIFRGNCAKTGLLCVTLPRDQVAALLAVAADPAAEIAIDLPAQTVTSAAGTWPFDFDAHAKHLLVEGLDGIALTLAHADAITAFEARRPAWLPTTRAR